MKFENVKVVATAIGFREGRMVPEGTEFRFTGEKLPKWVRLATDKAPAAKPKQELGETKPADAVAAVKRKAEGIA